MGSSARQPSGECCRGRRCGRRNGVRSLRPIYLAIGLALVFGAAFVAIMVAGISYQTLTEVDYDHVEF
jgi:hypothetical protein